MKNYSFLDDVPFLNQNDLLNEFQGNARRISELAKLDLFDNLVDWLSDNNSNLGNKRFVKTKIKLKKNHNEINVNKDSSGIIPHLAAAEFVVFCELFRGCSINKSNLNEDHLLSFSEKLIKEYLDKNKDKAINILQHKLLVADTLRCVQLLRELGFVLQDGKTSRQLAIGANTGVRDVDGTHAIPEIKTNKKSIISNIHNDEDLVFNMIFVRPFHVVLIDAGSDVSQLYLKINEQDESNKILAINEEIEMGLNILKKSIDEKKTEKRTLITGYRIDHNMIPDVPKFFSQISMVIDDVTELILTIGAGNNAKEFEGRVRKFDEIFDFLRNCNLNPVRIKMHADGSMEQQRRSHLFGHFTLNSHEIIFCKLKRKILEKSLINK
ncbi:MAG: hypothetical protein OEZ33_01010 [Gammaproteobacteria bacterium]|nr:hypothetical protein [Gammaproteobacteria bacterium]